MDESMAPGGRPVSDERLVALRGATTVDADTAGDVPLLCAGELDVVGGNPNTIRVLIHCYSTLPRESLRHVYLHRAKHLRDDLPE
jgi:chorismate mutase